MTEHKVDVDVDRAAEMYRGGMTISEVAEKFGVTAPTIRQRLADAGVEIRARGRDVKIDVERAAEMYRSGMSLAEVAAKFGVTAPTIRERLIDAGVEIRAHRQRAVEINVERAAEMYRSGMSLDEVAAKFGVSKQKIRRRLADVGAEMRARRRDVKIDVDRAARLYLYRSGKTLAEVAAQFGVSTSKIQQRLLAAGVEMRGTPTIRDRLIAADGEIRRHTCSKAAGIDADCAARLYRGGMTLDEVAAELGDSAMTIRDRLIEAAAAMRVRRRGIKIDVDHAAKLYRGGKTLNEVAAELGFSASTIRNRLIAAGVDTRRRPKSRPT